ncbi:hypothetical protein GOBAR_AA10814 [Gossypium barbadense]|uniref:Arabidopsis retrotransposon Orf1 C-terminal domain-containing protein n=1 Tax=Gossypium barbadense TaxID=3634 RepID=A0A2P5Y2J6_GOSBA|nr:hypothetical protein GOBAR_AA10814 [Gossypium barbadense]
MVFLVGPTAKIRHTFLQLPIEPQEELFQILCARPLIAGRCIDWATVEQVQLADAIWALLTTNPWEIFFGIIEATYLELTVELCSTFHLQTVMANYDDLGRLSFPEFGTALGLYTEDFKEKNDLDALNRHIHHSPSRCWEALVPGSATYNPSRSKASALSPSLRYLHAILAHTLIGRRESTGVMSPQAISSILSMRMIEKHQGTYPPQYRLAQSTEEEAPEDITDDVPPQHEDPPSQPPPPSRPVHSAASYADISEHLTRLEQQCFQQFDNIDATLQQICQHLHISLLPPPREPSSDEDV